MNSKHILITGATLGALGVTLGAFGAHAFHATLEEAGRLDTFELAVRYQFYHIGALLIIGVLLHFRQSAFLHHSAWSILVGVTFFSGSLYALCLTGLTWFAWVTPVGGLFLVAGWILFAIGIAKSKIIPLNEKAA